MAQQPVYQQQYQPQLQQPYQTQPQTYQPVQVQDMSYMNNKDDETALILFVIGFCCSIMWIVNSIMYSKSPNERARKFARLSWILHDIAGVLFHFPNTLRLIDI
ncbi:Transmembrane protein [Entamoeba marina]